jgi:hypothetical protein
MNQVIERPLDLLEEATQAAFEAMVQKLVERFGREFGIAGGAAGTWTFTNGSRTRMLNGTWDFDTDSFRMALLTSASNIGAATTTWAGVTGEVSGNGYAVQTITFSLSGTTTVTADSTDATYTASGGSIVARYACIYENGGDVVCYCLLDTTAGGTDVTVTDGNSLTVQISASGVFQLA